MHTPVPETIVSPGVAGVKQEEGRQGEDPDNPLELVRVFGDLNNEVHEQFYTILDTPDVKR